MKETLSFGGGALPVEMRGTQEEIRGYELLNPRQKEAVFCTEGPLLVLAGAGSGKTRVLTHRIAYLIEHKQVNPWNILAITFTNKAAGEMRERVDRQVEFGASSVWVSTFHSACVKILRRHIECLGYETNFTIYDADDQKTVMKQLYKAMNVNSRLLKEREALGCISSAKNELITPSQYRELMEGDIRGQLAAAIYEEYESYLKRNNALDFDDLILKSVELFQTAPEVLDYYQERFRYILIDEYQDTNKTQFELVRLLASKYRNLCVVGDDDQSIYKFRGADIGNILNFEAAFPGAKVIKLEQNYRSTQNILDAANSVIKHNRGRKEKTLWTANGRGEPIVYRQFDQAYEEAEFIVRDILAKGCPYEECAVLYRTNAQSRLLEEQCISYNLPYRLVGGVNFYQRREIKDILAYLKTICSGRDDLAVSRIVNVPKRGIGAASIGKAITFAAANGCSLYDAMRRAGEIPGLGKAAAKMSLFSDLIEGFRRRLEEDRYTLRQLIEDVLVETGYQEELKEEGETEAKTRLENIDELITKAVSYWSAAERPTLEEFLEEVALVADIDRMDPSEKRITLMTLHSAKGLEFEHVYLSGLEEGLFPNYMTIFSEDPGDLEEERRLCYVGITRARKQLTVTAARVRMIKGETRYSKASRFVEEIPKELLGANRPEVQTPSPKPAAGAHCPPPKKPSPPRHNAAPAFGKPFTIQKAEALDYGPGDRVMHTKFGCGTIEAIEDGPKDYEVTVNFDKAGIKKMFAAFAKLEKI